MKFGSKITAAILAFLMVFSVSACSKKDTDIDTDDNTGDDFSGSIVEKEDEKEDDPPEEDDGSEDGVITVTTYEQLSEMKRKGNYALGADIDLTGKEWEPIGTYGAPFEGTFDGKGHKITGLGISEVSEDAGETVSFTYSYCGFFGAIKNAVIKDTEFVSASIDVSDYHDYRTVNAGIICGLATDSEITGCKVSGTVSATSTSFIGCAGGIAGTLKGTEVKNCVSSADIETSGCSVRAESGGIAGATGMGSKLTGCSSSGSVSAVSEYEIAYAGGLIGYCFTTNVEKCYVTGNVYASVTSSDPERGTKGAAYAGGLAGTVSAATSELKSLFLKSYCTAEEIRANGIEGAAYSAGLAGSASFANFDQCYSVSNIKSESEIDNVYAAGLITVIDSETLISGCFTTSDLTLSAFNSAHVFVGTCAASFPSDTSEVIVNTVFRTDSVYKVNDNSYTKDNTETVKVTGSPRASNVFSNLSLICQSVGWTESEWTLPSGSYPVPV